MRATLKVITYLLFGIIVITASCTSETSKQAEKRLDQARTLYVGKQFEQSLRVLDSIQSWFPEEYSVLAEALKLRKIVAADYHGSFIEQASELLREAESHIEPLTKNFYFNQGSAGRPGSYEHKRQTVRNSWSRSFLKVNISEDGEFWISSKYYGKEWLDHFCIKVYDRELQVFSDTIPLNHPDNSKLQDGDDKWETIDYRNGTDGGAVGFIIENLTRPLKVRFTGKQHYYIVMEKFDKEAVKEGFELAQVLREVDDLREKIARHRKELRLMGVAGDQ